MAAGKIRDDLDGSVFVHHEDGTFDVLVAGDEVPEAYTGQVGEHLLAGSGVANPETQGDPNAVDLSGTAAEVLDRVGDDPGVAQRYLAAESEQEKPRKGLVAELEKRAAV